MSKRNLKQLQFPITVIFPSQRFLWSSGKAEQNRFAMTQITAAKMTRSNSDNLRRNPIGNRAISIFNGQKPCTRITLSMLQFFLHFLQAKDIIKQLSEVTLKAISHGTSGKEISKFREIVQTQVKFHFTIIFKCFI